MLPTKSDGASVLRIVFSVVPYGKKTAPTTGLSHFSVVGKLVEKRRLNAVLLGVSSGIETKSVTVMPGCSENTGPPWASTSLDASEVIATATAQAARTLRSRP